MSRSGRNPKSPAFQFYPGDFLSDPKVQAMSAEQVGAYLLLLCAEWLDGPLPDDHSLLAGVCRLTAERFEDDWRAIGRCFRPVDGTPHRIENPRLERERCFQKEGRDRRLAASKVAVDARIVNESSTNRATVAPLTLSPTPEALRPTPDTRIPTPCVEDGATSAPPPAPVADSAVEVETWPKAFTDFPSLDTPECHAAYRRWLAYRRSSKLKPWPQSTIKGSLSKFELHGPGAFAHAVDESISNGWQGLFPPRNGAPRFATVGGSARAAFSQARAPQAAEDVPHVDVR